MVTVVEESGVVIGYSCRVRGTVSAGVISPNSRVRGGVSNGVIN